MAHDTKYLKNTNIPVAYGSNSFNCCCSLKHNLGITNLAMSNSAGGGVLIT